MHRLLCYLNYSFAFRDQNLTFPFNNIEVSYTSQTWIYTAYLFNKKKVTPEKYTIDFFRRIYLGISELCLFQMALVDSKVCSAHDYRLHGEIQIWIQKESAKVILKYKLNNWCSNLNNIKTSFLTHKGDFSVLQCEGYSPVNVLYVSKKYFQHNSYLTAGYNSNNFGQWEQWFGHASKNNKL